MKFTSSAIVFVRPVRVLRQAGRNFLSHKEPGGYSATARVVQVGDPVLRIYDHRPRVAVPIAWAHMDTSHPQPYVLFEELDLDDQEKIQGLFPGNEFLVQMH